ncbi:CrpP-related protein [Achromobacter spanius]|uniref:Uncharacterized protein n=1 Tax=Achromobacter spanius TaxID=217203 RepID=A0A2S0IDM1_9BURK|nr:CrpP-related protein [Achromobacter spanius]AVJ30143.1 hypothetical protein CLM73_25290 [Achromobacter spanius]
MLEEIQARGAQAARNGWTLFDCPFFRADQMPGHTGEAISDWRQKVDAWETGWTREVASWHGATTIPPSGQAH